MRISSSKLRENLYKLLDSVIETGEPLEIAKKGHILYVIYPKKTSRLNKIIPKKITNASDVDLVHSNWEKEWNPFI